MRLTADLIQNSLSYINPLKERELDLRGHKIPAIENLGVARDQDCIDFTDNDISHLSNFPLNTRLTTLLLARNRVAALAPNLPQSIPNLTTIVLTQNNFAELADLDPLGGFARLTHMVLIDNPVTRKEHYRYYVIWRIPSLRFLDYTRVTDAERKRGRELFGTIAKPTSLALKIISNKSRASALSSIAAPQVPGEKNTRVKLTGQERKRVEELIKNAGSLAEIERLEKMLAEGRVPGGVGVE